MAMIATKFHVKTLHLASSLQQRHKKNRSYREKYNGTAISRCLSERHEESFSYTVVCFSYPTLRVSNDWAHLGSFILNSPLRKDPTECYGIHQGSRYKYLQIYIWQQNNLRIRFELLLTRYGAICNTCLLSLTPGAEFLWKTQTGAGSACIRGVCVRACTISPHHGVSSGGGWREGASSYGGQLRIYRIISREQPTMGGPPAWGLGVGLTTPRRKKVIRYERLQGASDLARPKQRKKGYRFGTRNKVDLREIGIDVANWIQLAQDRVQWRVFVNTVMNLRVP
jgi:hypothetical protein